MDDSTKSIHFLQKSCMTRHMWKVMWWEKSCDMSHVRLVMWRVMWKVMWYESCDMSHVMSHVKWVMWYESREKSCDMGHGGWYYYIIKCSYSVDPYHTSIRGVPILLLIWLLIYLLKYIHYQLPKAEGYLYNNLFLFWSRFN